MIWRHPIGFGALAAVGVILWLHRRRRRVADALVPSLVPWLTLRVAEPLRRRRVPPSVLLALHVLCAVLLAIALAGPERPGRPAPSGDLAIVVDMTLSMAAGDRWPAARAAVAQASAGAGGRVTLVALGAAPRMLAAPTREGRDVLAAFDRAAPRDVGADVPGALALASSVAGAGARLLLVTDGALDIGAAEGTNGSGAGGADRAAYGEGAAPRSVAVAGPIEWRIVGSDPLPDNVAVAAAAAAPEPGRGGTRLTADIGNFGSQPVRADVSVALGGRTVDRATVTLAAGGFAPMAWRLDARDGTASVTVRSLDAAGAPAGDALAADDGALVPLATRPRRIQVAGAAGAVRRAAAVQPDALVLDAGIGTLADDGSIDVTVIGGPVPGSLPSTGLLLVDPPAGDWSLGAASPVSGTWVTAAPHPITADLDLSDAQVGGVRATAAPPWADVLATVAGRPALWAGTDGDRRVVVFGFDPRLGTLAGRTPFPALVGRALAWASPVMPPPIVPAGKPFDLPPWPVAITAPDGRRTLAAHRFADTGAPGIYLLRRVVLPRAGRTPAGDIVAVVAGDRRESNLAARSADELARAFTPSAASGATTAPSAPGPTHPAQRWWLWAALLVLAVEALWRAAPARSPAAQAARSAR